MLRCDGDLDGGYVAMVSLLRWGFWLRCCFCFAGGFVALVVLLRGCFSYIVVLVGVLRW